ncbi:MAG: PhoH family protein, partial [Deltaproteobacteria bacterium]|nr:PhoH family protein [Deltaproteobacteria bacterium]
MEESEDVKEVLKFEDNETAKSLLGENDKHLRYIEYALHLTAHARGNEVTLVGSPAVTALGRKLLEQLYDLARRGLAVTIQDVEAAVNFMKDDPSANLRQIFMGSAVVSTGRRRIVPKSPAQKHYIETIENHDIVFGIGPAGTGKTYLAMAMAVAALSRREVSRVVLARPAVEAGEKLGFLPGDLAEKVNPYLRPLYDALHDMMEFDRAAKLVERGVIEVAPLAFMRGRAQPVTSRVLTPFGWRQIGHLEVGDHVIGSDGRPTRVLGIYPQGVKEVYRIVATDGASTLCCAEHLWAVFTPEDRRRGKPARVVNVRDIIGRLRRAHQHRFEIPLLGAPVDFPAREVPLHPYVLGLLLGDGCLTGKTTPTFATTDAELVRSLESYLPGIRVTHKAGVDYVLRHPKGGRGGLRIPNPVTLALR